MLHRVKPVSRQLESSCLASTSSFLLPSFPTTATSITIEFRAPQPSFSPSSARALTGPPRSPSLASAHPSLAHDWRKSPLADGRRRDLVARRGPPPRQYSCARQLHTSAGWLEPPREADPVHGKASAPASAPPESPEGVARGENPTGDAGTPGAPPRTLAETPGGLAPPFPPPSVALVALLRESHELPHNIILPPRHPLRISIFQNLKAIPPEANLAHLQALRAVLKRANLFTSPSAIRLLVGAMIARGEEGPAIRLLKEADTAMEQAGTPVKALAEVYETSLRKLLRRGKWEWMVQFTDAALLAGVVSDIILKMRLRALVEMARHKEVIKTFHLYAANSLVPNSAVYDDVVLSHLLNTDLAGADIFLAEKASKGFSTGVRTCLALLQGMRAFGGNALMERRMLEESGSWLREQDSVIVLNRIMSVRAERGEVRAALTLMTYYDLDALSTPISIPRLPPLTSTPAPQTPAQATLANLHRPAPDIATFAILMGISLRLHNPDNALGLFQQSQEARLGINEHLVTALVRTLLSQGNLPRAISLVLDLATGTARFSKTSLPLPALAPTPMMFEELFRATLLDHGLTGAHTLAEQIIQLQGRVEVTESLVAIFVRHLSVCRLHKSYVSAELIVRVSNLTVGVRKGTLEDLKSLLEAVWRKERVLKRRSRHPLFSNVRPAMLVSSNPTAAANALLQFPSYSTALGKIQASLADRDVTLDRPVVQQVMRRSTAQPQVLTQYLSDQLMARNVRPSVGHFAVIMRAHFQVGDANRAREAMQRALDMGLEHHVAWFSILIAGYARQGDYRQARLAYREMIELGIQPDKTLFAALAFVAARQGDIIGVRSIMAEASQRLPQPLDPLDPVFVSLQYRAFTTSSRLLEAQLLVYRLDRATFKPDIITLKMLKNTGAWIRHRLNTKQPIEQPENVAHMLHLYQNNLGRVRRWLNKRKAANDVGELKKLDRVLFAAKRRQSGGPDDTQSRDPILPQMEEKPGGEILV